MPVDLEKEARKAERQSRQQAELSARLAREQEEKIEYQQRLQERAAERAARNIVTDKTERVSRVKNHLLQLKTSQDITDQAKAKIDSIIVLIDELNGMI